MDVPQMLRNGPVLIALFVGLALVSGIGTVLLLGGSLEELLFALAGGLVVAIVVVGSYALGRRYGQPHSHAVAQSGVLFGVVMLIGTVANLLLESERISNMEVVLGLAGALGATIVAIGIIRLLDQVASPS